MSEFTTVAMLSSMGAAITNSVAKANYHIALTLIQSEEWDELAEEIAEMPTDGITPEFPTDWGDDDLPMPNPMPRLHDASSAATPLITRNTDTCPGSERKGTSWTT